MGNKKLNIRRIIKKAHKSAHFFFSMDDGEVCLDELYDNEIADNMISFICYKGLGKVYFSPSGVRCPDSSGQGFVSLVPSRLMTDWFKMLWNTDDLLESADSVAKKKRYVFFQSWADNYYTSFIGLELCKETSLFDLKLKTFETKSFKRTSLKFAGEILTSMTSGFTNAELDSMRNRMKKYRELFTSIFDKRQAPKVSPEIQALETLTRKAQLTEEYVEKNLPVRGKLYWFEGADKKGVSYIAKFRELSGDKKMAYFDETVVCQENIAGCLLNLEMPTTCCAGFRKVNDEEENKFERVFNDFRNSLVSFVVGQDYTLTIEDGFTYFGKLTSHKEDKSNFTLANVYCAHRGNKPKYFKEKKFITSHCENLRIASDEDKYFFKGVKEAYEESKKDISSLKPKDWCLMRNDDCLPWGLCQFAYSNGLFRKYAFAAVGGNVFVQCIPYEGNEKLLGTTKSPDDGN